MTVYDTDTDAILGQFVATRLDDAHLNSRDAVPIYIQTRSKMVVTCCSVNQ